MSMASEREQKYAQLHAYIEEHSGEQGVLMPVMQKAQEIFGCLDEETQRFIADELHTSVAEVYGVATFYAQFALEPKGKNIVGICMGTACYVRGASEVLDAIKKDLGVEEGRTTPDGLFTLEPMRCIGCCGLAPAVMIGDEVFGRLTPADVPAMLKKIRDRG